MCQLQIGQTTIKKTWRDTCLCFPCDAARPSGSSYQCIIRGSLFNVDTGLDCGDGAVIDDGRGAGAGAGAGAGVG